MESQQVYQAGMLYKLWSTSVCCQQGISIQFSFNPDIALSELFVYPVYGRGYWEMTKSSEMRSWLHSFFETVVHMQTCIQPGGDGDVDVVMWRE